MNYNMIQKTIMVGIIEPEDHGWRKCKGSTSWYKELVDSGGLDFDYFCCNDGNNVFVSLHRFSDDLPNGERFQIHQYLGQCSKCKDVFYLNYPTEDWETFTEEEI